MASRKFDFSDRSYNWATYLNARPQYPQALYDLVFQHHSQHCNVWDKAHDMGTGIGIVASRLSPKFKQVIASDPSDTHVASARDFLKENATQDIPVLQCKAEDAASQSPDSMDLITIAESIFYMDTVKAIDAAAKLLHPGGSLAIWSYDIVPRFVGQTSDVDQVIQQRIYELFDAYAIYFAKNLGTRPMSILWSDLMTLDFPKAQWSNVRRIYWRRHRELGAELSQIVQERPAELGVRMWETFEDHAEDILVVDKADPEWLTTYFDILYPGLPAPKICPAEFAALQESVKDAKPMQFGFSTTLILATRK